MCMPGCAKCGGFMSLGDWDGQPFRRSSRHQVSELYRYRPGSKVYYSAIGAPGVKGTVAKVVSEGTCNVPCLARPQLVLSMPQIRHDAQIMPVTQASKGV